MQMNLTLIQALKAIRIEDQHKLNSKIKNEMKAKVNLIEDKPKCKNINPKGKKSRNIITLILCSLNLKPLAISLMGNSALSVRESTIWLLGAFNGRKNRSNLLQKRMEETSSAIRSTW